MKVLMISTDRLIFSPGSEVRARLLDYGQLFAELHVVVFTHKKQGYQPEQLNNRVFIYPTNSVNRLSYLWGAIKIGKKLIKNKEDWVVTSQDPFETGLVAWWLKRKKEITWQAQIHTDFLSPFFLGESWLNWLRVKMAHFLLPQADKVRVVSERIKNSLKSWPLKSEPVVLPIFVSLPTNQTCDISLNLRQKYPQFSFVILMASRLTREKNYELTIKAFSRVALNKREIGLIIVGQGPEKNYLQNLAKSLKMEKQLIFEDWNNNLDCYYRSADLFMLSSNYEGYGRTLIEAGLNGCPVLTTDIGLIGEIINESNALVCPVDDEDCLVEKINWAVSEKKALQVLGCQLQSDLEKKQLSKGEYLQKYKEILIK